MDMVLSYGTGFTFHRIPPLVLMSYGDFPDMSVLSERRAVIKGAGMYGPFELPLHTLVTKREQANKTRASIAHVWSGELDPGMICETEYGFAVTSPALTILNMAATMPVEQITMMLYEMTGSFTVYRSPDVVTSFLQGLVDAEEFPVIAGWKPMLNNQGKITDLWSRPPLVSMSEIRDIAECARGVRGAKRLKQALSNVWGVARSPFEVQTAMLLGLSRRNGGYGLGPFELNKQVRLSSSARVLARQNECFIDLYLPGNEDAGPIGIECQGADYHGGSERSILDDNRALALQSMGITVVRLRYEQVCDPWRLKSVASYVAGELGRSCRPKSDALKQKELELRAKVLIDWWTLGR